MQLTCASCGRSFEAKRSSRKTCGERCRKRLQRQPAVVSDLSERRGLEDDAGVRPGPVMVATRAALEAAGRFESWAGQSAYALAARVDYAMTDTGSAFAALVREHRAAMAEAMRDAQAEANPLDELRDRRERRLGRG